MNLKEKGSILPVTIVAMLIMTIVGLICVQMFMLQNIMNTVDQARTRTFYAAEGATEMLRGYVNLNYPETNNAFSALAMPWQPIDIYINSSGNYYDRTIHPGIYARAVCNRLASANAVPGLPIVTEEFGKTYNYYAITGISSTTVSAKVITSTVAYYFYTVYDGTNNIKHFRGWREL